MKTETDIAEAIAQQGILPLFYHGDQDTCLRVAEALYQGGIRTMEFTNRGPEALACFASLVREAPQHFPDMQIGAGTITTADQAQAFMDAGAAFLVSPVFDAGVCDKAYLNKLLWIPGCMTPTEIHVAVQAGCTSIKLFPGQVLGPAFLEAVRPLFGTLQYLVTGGVEPTAESIGSWLQAGAAAVGLGSKLITPQRLLPQNSKALTEETARLLQILQQLKAQHP